LLILIRQRHWEPALERILQHPLDARFRDTPNRATPLHIALMHRAPHAVIVVLVDAFPTALLLQDTEGWTPLHVNILYGSHEDTTMLLIKRGGPMAASLHSKFVGSPLHLLCRHGGTLTTLQALISTSPEQVTVTNEVGICAPNLLYKSFLRRHDLNKLEDVKSIVAQLLLMVHAVYQGEIRCAHPRTRKVELEPSLHQVIHFQCTHAKETDLVRLVLQLYPNLATTPDARGRLPIHVAVSQPRSVFPQPTSSVYFTTPHDPLCLLLAQAPSLASHADPTTGRLPLHTAVSLLNSSHRSFRTGIQALIRACPAALQQRDPVNGLFPFQLAATATTQSSDLGSSECNQSTVVLETTFELLRACPSAIACTRLR
jgi:ankyrin repeat protein